MRDLDHLIDELASDAPPIRPVRARDGRVLFAAVAAVTLALVYAFYGYRRDVIGMSPPPMLAVALGLFALLAIAAGLGAVRMARPQVGAGVGGAPWALAGTLLLPVAALIALAGDPTLLAGMNADQGLRCFGFGLAAGSATLLFLALWLRRGAPVAPNKAAWLAGMSAGAVGAFANSLECPHDAITHLGIWHVATVVAGGLIGRVLLPRLLRW